MKSIIFNQHQVNHALKNKEGMFRVVIKPQPNKIDTWEKPTRFVAITEDKSYPLVCPYQVGQKIFCKESFFESFSNIYYRVDIDDNQLTYYVWKPAQHMKQEHSRLTLRIKSVKVERLADISEEDAAKEGIKVYRSEDGLSGYGESYDQEAHKQITDNYYKKRWTFKDIWNATHKKPEEKWEANPWVFAYEYEVVR